MECLTRRPSCVGCGCEEAAAAAQDALPAGGASARAFRGLAHRLRPFAPKSADDLPTSRVAVHRALSRCSREFAWRELHQQASLQSQLSVRAAVEDESEFCRICREGGELEPLITPCDCRGTVRFVHKSCLERWLAESDTSFCEICGLRYVTRRSPRYGLLKTVVLWALTARQDLFVDLLTVLTFVPLAVLGTSMGVSAGRSLCYGVLSEGDPDGVASLVLIVEPHLGPFATQLACMGAQTVRAAVLAVMAAMDVAVVAWLMLRVQQHAQRCHAWYRRHCDVHLVHPPPALMPPPPSLQDESVDEDEEEAEEEEEEEELSTATCITEDSRALSAALTTSRSFRRRSHKET